MAENNNVTNDTSAYEMPHNFIGTCVSCGIAVTTENVGQTQPKVMCSNCIESLAREKAQREAEAKAAEANRIKAFEEATRSNRRAVIIRMILANVVGLIVGVAFFFLATNVDTTLWGTAIGVSAFIFTYVATLFYPGSWTRTIFVALAFSGFRLPFIIFELDLDGCLMFLAFKLLGWVIGLLLGILGFILSVIIGIIISPAVYLFLTIRDIIALAKGEFIDE